MEFPGPPGGLSLNPFNLQLINLLILSKAVNKRYLAEARKADRHWEGVK